MSLFRPEVSEYKTNRVHGEIVLTQPLTVRVAVAALTVVVAMISGWVAVGSYARTESAPGILVTEQPHAKVIAPTPGIVSEMFVREGSFVRKGEKILVVSLDRHPISGTGVAAEGLAALSERRRLSEGQIGLSARRSAAERLRIQTGMAAAGAQAASLDGQIKLQERVVASNRTMLGQIERVVDRGFVSRVELERRRLALISSEQSLASLQQQLLERRSQVSAGEAQLAGLDADAARDVSEIRSTLQGMSQQKAQMEGEEAYVLAAPISGRVTAVEAGMGRSVSASKPLMIIVPTGSTLQAEIYAPSRAIGFIEPGQETRLLYDAFPYQRFGSSTGRVKSISQIVIDPREAEVPLKLEEPVYRVVVTLDRQTVDAYGQHAALQSGMTLTANVVLERQSFIDWLLKPLHAVMRRAA